jgi:hypothetical protein
MKEVRVWNTGGIILMRENRIIRRKIHLDPYTYITQELTLYGRQAFLIGR